MTPDLYAALGVGRDADKPAVHRAYRRAAKHAHPDVPGGSDKRFALVKLAHDTLTDEARRSHYDATGEINEPPPDNKQAHALQCIAAAFEAVLAECESSRQPPATVNLLASMRRWINVHLTEGTRLIARLEELISENEALAGRFTGGVMEQILTGRVTMMRAKIESMRANHMSGQDALKLLEGVTFEPEERPKAASTSLAQMIAGSYALR